MNPEKRRRKIAEYIKHTGFASVVDLAERFGVTEVTIRADIRSLAADGLVQRSHGGAMATSRSVVDLNEDIKATVNVEQKNAIAKAAAALVSPNDSILIASGSTMVSFAEMLAWNENIQNGDHINVVTPSIRVSMKLLDTPGISLLQLGGVIYPNTLSTRGDYAVMGLEIIHCTKLFFGAEGFDLENGVSCATLEEAMLTREMMKAASQIILLADSSKFAGRGFGRICMLENVDVLVTDDGLAAEARRSIEELGITVIIA